MMQPLWNTACQFVAKLSIVFPYDPVVASFGIYPNDLKIYVYTITCKQIFIAILKFGSNQNVLQ